MRKILKRLSIVLFFITGILNAQDITVSGTVTDLGSGQILPTITVQLKGTLNGVVTDFDGNYTIQAPPDGILIFSYIGFASKEVPIDNRNTINVAMEEEASQLGEVVVVGFGTQKKSNVSVSLSNVAVEKLLGERPIVNAAQLLQGASTGLNVVSTSGQPGSTGTSINIRGFTSINGGGPLILINNVPGNINDLNPRDIESVSVLKDASAAAIYGSRAAFGVVLITTKQAKRNEKMKISLSSITSVSRITDSPKKATTRQFVETLDFIGDNNYFAGQNIDRWIELLGQYDNNPSQLNLVSDPVSGETYPIHFENSENQFYPLADSDIVGDYIDNFGYSTVNNLTLSGGGSEIAYRVNLGYSFEDGVIITDKDSFSKFNIATNLNANITSNLRSISDIQYRSSRESRPNQRYDEVLQLRMFDPTGFFDDGSGQVLPFASPGNIVRFSDPTIVENDNLRLFEKLEYKPFNNFTLIGEYTYQKNSFSTKAVNNGQRYYSTFRFNPTATEATAAQNTSLTNSQSHRVYSGLNIYGKYNLAKGNHNADLLLGFNRESERFKFFSARRNGLIDPTTPSFELAEGSDFDISDSFYEWGVVGYFGRLNYNFNERYFLTANLRYDGSSRFASDSRYVWLPSASFAWNVAKETFMENVGYISLLKPRVSYGIIGNQITPNLQTGALNDYYPTIPGYSPFSTEWINLDSELRYTSFLPAQLIRDDFTWEEVRTKNAGIDIAFLKNRINASFDIYERETLGMLRPAGEVPAVLGTDLPLQNAADLSTIGWEVELGYNDKKGDFSYGISVRVWDNQSEITNYENPELLMNIGQSGLNNTFYNGMKIGDIWGYETEGYYTANDFVEGTLNADLSGSNRQLKSTVPRIFGAPVPYPGDVKYRDLDGDGWIGTGNNTLIVEYDSNGNPITNSEGLIQSGMGDRTVIGNTTRRYQFGINGNVGYKGFDLSFVLTGVGKRDRWRGSGSDRDIIFPYPSLFDHIYEHQLDYWTPDNQNAFYPRLYGNAQAGNNDSNYGNSQRIQTKYLSDESYLRIQNITIGYNFNKALLDKIDMDAFRVFIAGNNIHTFDRLPPGLEPDQNSVNILRRYPIMAQYSIGFNLSF